MSLLACAAGALMSCERPQAPAASASVPAHGAQNAREAASALGTYRVRIEPRPDPIPLNDHFELRIVVADAAGTAAPPGTLSVSVNAVMPAHGHGMTTTPTVSARDSGYHVTGLLFHMPGEWQLWVDVAKDGPPERTRFTVVVS